MGKLYFYYSAMNAGKSTTLVQSAHNYHERGMRTILFCPDFDTRVDDGEGQEPRTAKIHSRLGLSRPAVLFNKNFDFHAFVAKELEKDRARDEAAAPAPKRGLLQIRQPDPTSAGGDGPLRCLLVDEAHFLTKAQVAQLMLLSKFERGAGNAGIAVLCYGLRTDFLGEPFEGSKYLLAWAEEMVEIKTICGCGSKATMNVRGEEVDDPAEPGQKIFKAVDQGAQVCIGGNECYVSTCARHFEDNVGTIGRAARGEAL